ncbi:uncharacterized protein PAC_18859 [Phialocephala subalpina]|uniref:Uncharacterized protein n=1 Tax=Phialocephala subalpina TaxID=576137 RepID=A0A1L7XVC4_9HELO|nr:uncharacterized protein PAC_18859 [Phialocephala subalpina]
MVSPVIVPINDSLLRGFLRVYFLIAFFAIGFLGGHVSKGVNKLKVSSGKQIKMIEMTGWLQFADILKSLWFVRRLPGGVLLGLLMLLASIGAVVSDVATSAFVDKQMLPSRCAFHRGLVIDANSPSYEAPPPNGAGARMAEDSQLNSLWNNGRIGIYSKANNRQDFRAASEDVMGWWSCSRVQDSEPLTANDTVKSMAKKLIQANLQYSIDNMGWNFMTSASWNEQVIIWSSSTAEGTNFEVKASLDLGKMTASTIFSNYHCYVNSSSPRLTEIHIILGTMNATLTMLQWTQNLPQYIYYGQGSPQSNRSAESLEIVLNALTMVQGAMGFMQERPLPGTDTTYGCVAPKTNISPFVVVLAVSVAFSLLGLLTWWMYLLLRLGKMRSRLEPFPNHLLTWMLQATRENVFSGHRYGPDTLTPVKESDLNAWRFGMNGTLLRVMRRDDTLQLTSMVSPGGGELISPQHHVGLGRHGYGRVDPWERV